MCETLLKTIRQIYIEEINFFLFSIKYKKCGKYCTSKNVYAHIVPGEGLRVKQSPENFTVIKDV